MTIFIDSSDNEESLDNEESFLNNKESLDNQKSLDNEYLVNFIVKNVKNGNFLPSDVKKK